MSFSDGYHDLPAGKLAAVVTCLETFERPVGRRDPPDINCTLVRHERPDLNWYRDVFRRIGEPVLWYSRLELSDDDLAAIVHDPRVEIYTVRVAGEDAGLLELDFRVDRECELVFFGVVEYVIGQGIGRWLMNRALDVAWAHDIGRMWVHTCTLDYPGIVPFYLRSGFRPFKRQVEVFDDPRRTGLLSRAAAPHVPLL